MSTVFIGIGSNINPEENIRSGIQQLSELGSVLNISGVYESKAYGFVGDNFYNLAVAMETELPPRELNRMLREIEDNHGRLREIPRFTSRALDLDLLIYDDLINHDEEVDVPRQDILTYAFVIKPLAEIAGDIIHPESGAKLSEIWDSFNQSNQDIWPVKLDLAI